MLADENPDSIVEFDDLILLFYDIGTVKAVDGVSSDPGGKTVGSVGEERPCGKSVTSLSLMQLVQRPQGQIVSGAIRFDSEDGVVDIAKMPTEAMRRIRGKQISMVFQEPMTSLNPVFRIGMQVDEVIALHNHALSAEAVIQRTVEMLEMVGIANSQGVYRMYPHELSGGMRHARMIAMALALSPRPDHRGRTDDRAGCDQFRREFWTCLAPEDQINSPSC
jgi:peptide/nickel transport system ATP-binding protein